MDFYNRLGEQYDRMTNPGKRMERERDFFMELVRLHNVTSALDIGCGTGHHMKMIIEAGISVTGLDPSAGLLKEAEKNLRGLETSYRLHKGSFMSIPETFRGTAELIYSVGNTIPHIMTEDELRAGFENVRRALKPGGIFALQFLNYEKILKEKNRIVNITRSGEEIFVRFYDFLEDTVRFNILIITGENDSIEHRLISSVLRPWSRDEVKDALQDAGFDSITVYGDYAFTPYEGNESGSVVFTAV